MNAQMTHEIIAQATKYNAFELPDLADKNPAEMSVEEIKTYIKFDDGVAETEAKELIGLATGAFTQRGIRSDAIMEILYAAKVTSPADEPGLYEEVYSCKGETEPSSGAPAPSSSAAAFGAAAEPDEASGGEIDINAIVPGYDDAKVAELKKAILESAASGDLTEEEWAKIKAYEEANEERKTILKLEPEFKKPEPASASSGGDAAFGGVRGESIAPDPGYGDPGALSSAYESGALGLDQVHNEGLPVPREYGGDEPILPVDITQVSHEELSRLVMRFHSLEARALWLISQEAGRRDVADGLAKDAWSDAFASNFSRLKSEIEKETGTAIDNARSQAKHEADINEHVKTWRIRSLRHGAEVRSLEALAAGWEKANNRLSREQTRREKLAETRA